MHNYFAPPFTFRQFAFSSKVQPCNRVICCGYGWRCRSAGSLYNFLIVQSGEQILHVVRDDQDVEIETIFTDNDIGFVEIGQQADINLDACPSARFGFATGMVSDVAANSTEATEGI